MKGRVVHVGPSLRARGGVTMVMRRLGESPLSADYHLEFVASIGAGAGSSKFLIYPICVVRVWLLAFIGRADLFHLHTASRGSFRRKYLLSRIVLLAGKRYVVHLHGGGFEEFRATAGRRLAASIDRYFAHAAAVFVVSEGMAHFVRSTFDIPEPVVVPNPVRIPDQPTSGLDTSRVVTVGHLGPEKGTDVLIDAMQSVLSSGVSASLVLIGDAARGDLRARVEAGPLAEHVTWFGWVSPEEVSRVLATCAVFVLPSLNEGMPLSLLEAMATGLACVVTPVGGIPEVVEDRVSGVFVEPRDASALSSALVRVLSDKTLRHRLGAEARQRMRGRSPENAACVIASVYERLGVFATSGGGR